MKRIVFSKLTQFGLRPGTPGYLFLHPSHPGREFVITRGTRTNLQTLAFKYDETWRLYDRRTGASLSKAVSPTKRRTDMEVVAAAKLRTITPERMQQLVDDWVVYATMRCLKVAA